MAASTTFRRTKGLVKIAEIPLQACPRCLAPLSAIKGSRLAVCRRCGYKDDCC